MSTKNIEKPEVSEEDRRRQPEGRDEPERASQTITAAVAEPGRKGKIRQVGTISSDLQAVEKLLARLRKGRDVTLRVCYSRAERDRLHLVQPGGR